jgi:hypothetical protein
VKEEGRGMKDEGILENHCNAVLLMVGKISAQKTRSTATCTPKVKLTQIST